MEKEGKLSLIFILIASFILLLMYVVFVSGEIPLEFPRNNTNASATRGFAGTFPGIATFNGSLGQFKCNITTLNTTTTNITNVSLFINISQGVGFNIDNKTSVRNQTLNTTTKAIVAETIIFNVTTPFNDGVYAWWCEMEDNQTSLSGNRQYNASGVNFFTIDTTPPLFNNSKVYNTSTSTKYSTGDLVAIQVNVSDQLTLISAAKLFVNISGLANNEVNRTVNTTNPLNLTLLNLSFRIPGNALFSVLNFTIMVNDSVHNYNITPAVIFVVEGDGTPPSITLNKPVTVFNQSSTTAPDFNFTAVDNNNSLSFNLTCGINISLGGSLFATITPITATNGTPQINTTTTALSNGTYTWNVSCTDPAGNSNTSLSSTFTVDNIRPVPLAFNITHNVTFGFGKGHNELQLGAASNLSTAQGRIIFAVSNWTDNLTRPFAADLQFFNISDNTWVTLNTTMGDVSNNLTTTGVGTAGFANLSFKIPTGHNNFEGKNITFRIRVNDSLGNSQSTDNITGTVLTLAEGVGNITIQVNDTTIPTVIINGTIEVNGTNISNTRPLIGWAVTEPNQLTSINVSVDSTLPSSGGGVDGCGKSAFYSSSLVGTNNVEKHRNDSFHVEPASTDPSCPLTNGTHFINITTVDAWGNRIITGHTFTIETATPTITLNSLENNLNVSNKSTVTSNTFINFSAVNGPTGRIKNLSFTSICNSTGGTFTNFTGIKPFKGDCETSTANRTLTVTATDFVGNSISEFYQFLVDNTAPSLAVASPKDGSRISGNVHINLSARDDTRNISRFGYFLDDGIASGNLIRLNGTVRDGFGILGENVSLSNITNFTAGTHTIKFTASDAMGTVENNTMNSSVITFTVTGPLTITTFNTTLRDQLNTLNPNFLSNTSIKVRNGTTGTYSLVPDPTVDSDQTFEILLSLYSNSTVAEDSSNPNINVTISEINGSGANWGRLNITVFLNESRIQGHVINNWSNSIKHLIHFNGSIDEFLSSANDYYGTVLLPGNLSVNGSGHRQGGEFQEIWWFADETDFATRTNVTQCSLMFTARTSSPCWNYTSGGKTIVYVPHFSDIVTVNNTGAPNITINKPDNILNKGNHSVSMFEPNITVTLDTVSCIYQVNGSTPQPMTIVASTTCIGQTERFGNQDGIYNITFNATDAYGNVRSLKFHLNMSDTTAPHNGIVTSSGATDGATITITGANESVNVTVSYNSQNASFSNKAYALDFNKTQTVTISGITAVSTATLYYYNITVCDFNGNCKNNGTFTFTQTATAAAAAAAAAASSGGGGGGAAAPSAEAASTSKKWDSLGAGSSAVLTINNANIAVTGVVVDVKSAVTNAEVKVASLTSNPIVTAAAGKVYQYLQLTKSNIADSDASKITISFRVPKSWLSSNNVAEGDVVLYRYSDSKWNGLPTTMSGSDANNVLYSATTPGFSTFAVGNKEAAPAAVPAGEAPAAPAEKPTEAPAAAPAEKQAEAAMEKKGLSTSTIAWIVVALIVVVAGIGYFMMQKKKDE